MLGHPPHPLLRGCSWEDFYLFSCLYLHGPSGERRRHVGQRSCLFGPYYENLDWTGTALTANKRIQKRQFQCFSNLRTQISLKSLSHPIFHTIIQLEHGGCGVVSREGQFTWTKVWQSVVFVELHLRSVCLELLELCHLLLWMSQILGWKLKLERKGEIIWRGLFFDGALSCFFFCVGSRCGVVKTQTKAPRPLNKGMRGHRVKGVTVGYVLILSMLSKSGLVQVQSQQLPQMTDISLFHQYSMTKQPISC